MKTEKVLAREIVFSKRFRIRRRLQRDLKLRRRTMLDYLQSPCRTGNTSGRAYQSAHARRVVARNWGHAVGAQNSMSLWEVSNTTTNPRLVNH